MRTDRRGYWKAYYKRNRGRMLRSRWLYYRKNRAKVTEARHRRRCAARNGESGENFTGAEFDELRAVVGFECVACHRGERLVGRLEPDHIVPVSKGGSNRIENIQPLCKQCNSGKRDREVNYLKVDVAEGTDLVELLPF